MKKVDDITYAIRNILEGIANNNALFAFNAIEYDGENSITFDIYFEDKDHENPSRD